MLPLLIGRMNMTGDAFLHIGPLSLQVWKAKKNKKTENGFCKIVASLPGGKMTNDIHFLWTSRYSRVFF